MKTNRSILILCSLATLGSACKDKEVWVEDSPYITVNSPTRNQALEDKDSVTVMATIAPKNSSVKSYHVWLMDHQKNVIINKITECDCGGMKTVSLKESFQYNISKTADLLLHVSATLEDGSNIREEVPFKFVDVKK